MVFTNLRKVAEPMIRILVVALTILVCDVAHSQFGKPGDLKMEPHTYKASSGEEVAAELGRLVVPARHENPDGATFELAFVRFPSTSANPGPPIVYLAGGPGGSGIGSARGKRFPLFMAMREFGDVIAFDQRGTGLSEPKYTFTIESDYPLDEVFEPKKYADNVYPQIQSQLEKLKTNEDLDLRSFTTNESADDLNMLRVALGADKITLWGISYGTHLSFATLRRHAQYIDKAILAGVEGPDDTLKLPSDQQVLIEEVARRAESDPNVNAILPDVMESLEEVFERVRKKPVFLETRDPVTREKVNVLIDHWTLQYHVAGLIGRAASVRLIPVFVSRALKDDFKQVGATAMRLRRHKETNSVMAFVMDCASGATAKRIELIANEASISLIGDAINSTDPFLCGACGDVDVGDEFRSPLDSDVPTLFISGTLDGRTAVANAEKVRTGFSRNDHLIIDGAGHSDDLFLGSPEILKVMQAFMRNEDLPTTAIELAPIKFVRPRK